MKFKQTEFGEVPEGWTIAELGSLISRGPDNGLYKPQSDYGDGTPIVRIDGFNNGDIVKEENLRRVRLADDEIARFILNRDDILINRVNSLSHIGKVSLIGSLSETTVFESNMMRLAVDEYQNTSSFCIPCPVI